MKSAWKEIIIIFIIIAIIFSLMYAYVDIDIMETVRQFIS